jgi:septal ring factor EnvC (AmiA/AmiB activator)
MLDADRATWQNPRILALLLLVFLCGALVGALTMRVGLRAKNAPAADFNYEMLQRELKLSPDQSAQLRSILDDMVKYHQDLQAQLEDFRATGKNRIRQILNPPQRERFEKLCNDLASR